MCGIDNDGEDDVDKYDGGSDDDNDDSKFYGGDDDGIVMMVMVVVVITETMVVMIMVINENSNKIRYNRCYINDDGCYYISTLAMICINTIDLLIVTVKEKKL